MMNMKSFVVAVSLITTFPVTSAHAWCSPKPYDGYILEGETASDPRTGLTWMRCVVGQKWDAQKKKCSGEPTKITWFSAFDAAIAERSGEKDDWRLPSSRVVKNPWISTVCII